MTLLPVALIRPDAESERDRAAASEKVTAKRSAKLSRIEIGCKGGRVLKVDASSRQPLPDHVPRQEVFHQAACACPVWGGADFIRNGEAVTEVLDYFPASFRIVRHVQPRFTCNGGREVSRAAKFTARLSANRSSADARFRRDNHHHPQDVGTAPQSLTLHRRSLPADYRCRPQARARPSGSEHAQ